MANWQLNRLILVKQYRRLALLGCILLAGFGFLVYLLADSKTHASKKIATLEMSGIVNEAFTEAHTQSALSAQQETLEELKTKLTHLSELLAETRKNEKKALQAQAQAFQKELKQVKEGMLLHEEKLNKAKTSVEIDTPPELKDLKNPNFWHNQPKPSQTSLPPPLLLARAPSVHAVSFRSKPIKTHKSTSAPFIPANTSVRAIVLGGADADASVNGQSKNNGVMLFKLLEEARLPNGQRARLQGCRVSANSYGDISSERAFATLYKLSCAFSQKTIIEKEVTGWVFYKGKVGIKGQPVMKDGKVLTWAGVSGALAGIGQAAQYAQSVQNIGPYGASSLVPSGAIAPFAAYGGASKAADTLSQYYVKRAEQYHPVIPIGAANEVTIVFKDGFYLEPEEVKSNTKHSRNFSNSNSFQDQGLQKTTLPNELLENSKESSAEMNFTVPPEVLQQIDRSSSSLGVSP